MKSFEIQAEFGKRSFDDEIDKEEGDENHYFRQSTHYDTRGGGGGVTAISAGTGCAIF